MKIEELKSKSVLSQFTESYWVMTANDYGAYPLIPDGTFNVFLATTPFSVNQKSFESGIYLCPILTRTLKIKSNGDLFGIRLKAFSLINVLDTHGVELKEANSLINLTTLKLDYPLIIENLKHVSSSQQALDILQSINSKILRKESKVNQALRAKVNYILDRQGKVNIAELSSHFNMSRQAIHKSFKKNLGISPKELCDTWRLNNYIRLIALNKGVSFTSCAIDAGFYDQAHCINTFKTFWQDNPKNYLQQDKAIIKYISESINKRFTNYYDPEEGLKDDFV